MVFTFLGTGTSHGVPVIGCSCKVCASADPHDFRFRTSAHIQCGDFSLLIDAGPDFRSQALAQHISAINMALITHSHADHIHGIDDLRIFSHRSKHDEEPPLPLYSNAKTLADIKARFSYIFEPVNEGGGKPNINLLPCESFTPESPLNAGGLQITYIPMRHGSLAAAGWVISQEAGGQRVSIAYLTDCNAISDESIALIHKAARIPHGRLAHIALDGLRPKRHSTHFSFDESLECAKKIGAEHTWITHLAHTMTHEEVTAYFKERGGDTVLPAFDGLSLEV